MEEEVKQAKAGTTKGNPGNTTSTTDKTLQTREAKGQEEGGASMSDRAVLRYKLNIGLIG